VYDLARMPPAAPCQMTGGAGSCRPAPAVLPAVWAPGCGPVPQLFSFGDSTRIQLVLADDLMCPPCPLPRITPNPLLGTWYRDVGVGMVAVTFTRDEMKVCLAQSEDATTSTTTITAHYTITKDGLVYGAITSADVDVKFDSKARTEAGMELAELSLMLQELSDRPFSFRTKTTSTGLMVSQLKAASGEVLGAQELALFGGLYKFAKDGRVPAPPALKTIIGGLVAPPAPSLVDQPLPPPPTMTLPLSQGSNTDAIGRMPPVCPEPARPAPNAMKAMAADAFGQMLLGGTQPQPGCVPSVPPIGGYNLLPVGATVASVAPAKPGPLGTWYREIGPKQCVVKVETDHLTVTVSEAHEFEGKTVTGHLILTADYHLTRDGLTVVGLLTSVDVKFDGDLPEDDMQSMLEKVGDLQKALEEKPFAMTFRRYGEALVIGNVRMPDVGDRMELQPATYVGGRYKSVGDKPLPKLKVTKASEPKPVPVYVPLPGVPGAIGLPVQQRYVLPPDVPLYGSYPQAITAPAPTGDLLPPQTVPCPTAPRPLESVVPAPRVQVIEGNNPRSLPMIAPALPTMQMPQPAPLSIDLGKPVVPPSFLNTVEYTIPLGFDLRLPVPPLGSIPNTPEQQKDHRQLFNFSIGLFGGP
jgi:hypothetical protein